MYGVLFKPLKFLYEPKNNKDIRRIENLYNSEKRRAKLSPNAIAASLPTSVLQNEHVCKIGFDALVGLDQLNNLDVDITVMVCQPPNKHSASRALLLSQLPQHINITILLQEKYETPLDLKVDAFTQYSKGYDSVFLVDDVLYDSLNLVYGFPKKSTRILRVDTAYNQGSYTRPECHGYQEPVVVGNWESHQNEKLIWEAIRKRILMTK